MYRKFDEYLAFDDWKILGRTVNYDKVILVIQIKKFQPVFFGVIF
jgi:hypothetical protein